MIEEQYVSFKTGKLLKEKGFNVETSKFYNPHGEICENSLWISATPCPTQALAIRWLREKHNVHVLAYPEYRDDELLWGWKVILMTNPTETWRLIDFHSYEEACEEGILSALTNLVD